MSAAGFLALAVAGGAGALGIALTVALAGPTNPGTVRRPSAGRARPAGPHLCCTCTPSASVGGRRRQPTRR